MRDPEDEIVRIDVNGPVAVIGDIHGRSDLLKLLLKKLGKTMPVFFVGDLVDRGPDAFGVIEVLMARKARGIRGNHEEWLRKWFAGEGFNGDVLQRAFGAGATLASYGIAPGEPYGPRYVEVPPAHRRFINELPLVLDLTVDGKPYWVIHAGVHKRTPLEPGTPPEEAVAWLVENEPYDLLWNGGFIEDAAGSTGPSSLATSHTRSLLQRHAPSPSTRGVAPGRAASSRRWCCLSNGS